MAKNPIVEEMIQKSLEELSISEKPVQHSRTWESPTAYKYLVQWSNSVLLRYLVRLFTTSLPKSEYRRKAQLDDAARSVVRNIEEGWKRSNTATYLEFIGFSQGSLEEVKGDIRELAEDGFLRSKPGSSLKLIGIHLGALNLALKPGLKESKGDLEDVNHEETIENRYKPKSFRQEVPPPAYTPLSVLYPPLNEVRVNDLSVEIFLELINKTDFLLRKLVESLETKLANDRKGYQIGQSKIKDAIRKK